MALSLEAQIRQHNAKAQRNVENAMRTAIQYTVEDAQTPVTRGGNMPVDLGNLRNSLVSGLDGSFGSEGPESYVLTIAGMKAGDIAQFGWTAEYARNRHYRPETFGQGGGMFRDKAAAKWQSFVDKAAKRFSE